MEIVADVVIIAIIAVSVIVGYKKGLIRMLFKCLTVAAAVAVAFYLGPMLGSFIETTEIYGSMSVGVSEKLSAYFDDVALSGIDDAVQSKISFEATPFAETLTRFGFDSDRMLEHYESAVISGAQNIKTAYVGGVTDYILSCLSKALGHLIVFIIAFFAIKLLGKLAEKLFDVAVLKTINKVGGCVFGAVFGIAIAYIACMALEMFLPYIPENSVVYMGMADKTFLYRAFVSFNPATLIFVGLAMKQRH